MSLYYFLYCLHNKHPNRKMDKGISEEKNRVSLSFSKDARTYELIKCDSN